MTMFHVIKAVYKPAHFGPGYRVEWDRVVGIEAPTAAEAIGIAKAAGHIAPILDDFRSAEQRERDRMTELTAMREEAKYVR